MAGGRFVCAVGSGGMDDWGARDANGTVVKDVMPGGG